MSVQVLPVISSPKAWWRRGSLSQRIIAALVLGILVGLFFGEGAAVLQPLADVYIRLMQMTVLPYLVLTLLIGLGQLNLEAARRMAWRAALILLASWLAALMVVGAMALALPDVPNSTFYNPSLAEEPRSVAFADLYIPANPFSSLANAVVPAVVLFTAAVGIALMALPNKQVLLENLRIAEGAVVRVTHFVVGLTPIGAFAICAVAAGTLEPSVLARLEAYLIVFAFGTVLLTFVIIPLLVTAVTPFRYRDVLGGVKDPLLTAFFANNVFIVLPILTERAKELVAREGRNTAETDSAADVLVPMAFTFPNAGRLMTLLFVPFTAWLSGVRMGVAEYATLFGAGVGSYFAKAQVALPFLMDLLGIPHGLIALYIPTTIITGKFDSMVSAINLFAIVLLGSASLGGFLVWDGRRLLRALAAIAVALVATMALTRSALALFVDTTYRKDQYLMQMQLPAALVPTVVRTQLPPAGCPVADPRPTIERLRTRGTLRVGFVPDTVPYAFVNAGGSLVGFDLELANRLAFDLGVGQLELVPVSWQNVGEALRECRIDAMLSVPLTLVRPGDMHFSAPYLDTVVALAVRDDRRHEFANARALRALAALTVGLPETGNVAESRIIDLFRGTRALFVRYDKPRGFFEGAMPQVDALLMRAEAAASWSLLYPNYAFIVPAHAPRVPLVVGLRPGDLQLAAFVDNWLMIQNAEGRIEKARQYWMLGHSRDETAQARWSIRRNVLNW